MSFKILKKKIEQKKIVVGIVGVGYVGLKLLIEFSKSKVNTIGIDQDKEKINNLRKSKSTISYIKNKELIMKINLNM